MIKHSQITQSNKFAISLQYLKKEVRYRVFTSWHYHFWWKWPDMSKKSKILLLWSKMFRYCMGVQSCSLLLVIFYFYLLQSCNFNYSNLLLFINNSVGVSHCNHQPCSYSYWCKNVLVCPGEKSSFEKLRLLLFSKLNWSCYILCITKIASKILQPWFVPRNFLLLRLYFTSVILSHCLAWNTVTMLAGPKYHLDMLDKLQKPVLVLQLLLFWTFSLLLKFSLSESILQTYITLVCSSELMELVPLLYVWGVDSSFS